jgi:hypothetical protein
MRRTGGARDRLALAAVQVKARRSRRASCVGSNGPSRHVGRDRQSVSARSSRVSDHEPICRDAREGSRLQTLARWLRSMRGGRGVFLQAVEQLDQCPKGDVWRPRSPGCSVYANAAVVAHDVGIPQISSRSFTDIYQRLVARRRFRDSDAHHKGRLNGRNRRNGGRSYPPSYRADPLLPLACACGEPAGGCLRAGSCALRGAGDSCVVVGGWAPVG